ncbi:TPA: hypothetical protein ACF3DY_005241 [Klebsiella quasipneumoniae subsp. similipneumoniae]
MNLLTEESSFKDGIKRKKNGQEGITNIYRKSLRAAGLYDFAPQCDKISVGYAEAMLPKLSWIQACGNELENGKSRYQV